MKKRGATIKHRRQAPPTLVAMQLAPEVSISERMAIVLMKQGSASTSHFNILLDCQHMLTFGAADKHDEEAINVAQFSDIAMKSIRDRHRKTGKLGATGEEIKALQLLVDYSESYWKRTSGTAFADAYKALDTLREQQKVAA